jgi:hypothetical protein
MAMASQIWPQRMGNGLRWPYDGMMVSRQHRLLYVPVAKCACTSLKTMMIKLAGIDCPDIAVELGVHVVTDKFNTGAQLKDLPMDTARQILASDDYFKFSVVREPFERLVSAYLEKFVYRRHSRSNLEHTGPVLTAAQGGVDIDPQRGISFDQFIAYILGQDPYDLDPHWRPQHLYLRGLASFSRAFRLEEIDKLEKYLREQKGIEVQLGHQNRTRKSDQLLADACILPACEFDGRGAVDPASFSATTYTTALRDYYREDFALYESAC